MEDFDRAAAGFGQSLRMQRTPHLALKTTDYGFILGARREAEGDAYYWRITQYHIPFHSMPPVDLGKDKLYHTHMWFLSDDDHLVNWCVSWHPSRPLTESEREAMSSGLRDVRRCLKSLMLGNPSYHQVSHGDVNHRLAALREELIILVQSPVFVQPTECPLHAPPFGQNHKPFHVVGGLDNLETNLAIASKLPHPSDEWPV